MATCTMLSASQFEHHILSREAAGESLHNAEFTHAEVFGMIPLSLPQFSLDDSAPDAHVAMHNVNKLGNDADHQLSPSNIPSPSHLAGIPNANIPSVDDLNGLFNDNTSIPHQSDIAVFLHDSILDSPHINIPSLDDLVGILDRLPQHQHSSIPDETDISGMFREPSTNNANADVPSINDLQGIFDSSGANHHHNISSNPENLLPLAKDLDGLFDSLNTTNQDNIPQITDLDALFEKHNASGLTSDTPIPIANHQLFSLVNQSSLRAVVDLDTHMQASQPVHPQEDSEVPFSRNDFLWIPNDWIPDPENDEFEDNDPNQPFEDQQGDDTSSGDDSTDTDN